MATADNLKIAQQLFATMQQITAQVEKQTAAYRAQTEILEAICKAQECFGRIDSSKVKEITEALQKVQEKTEGVAAKTAEATEQVGTLRGAVLKLGKNLRTLAVPVEMLRGFQAGINFSDNFLKGILSFGGPAIDLMKDLAGILFSLPGRFLDFFTGAAEGGTDPYRAALEDLREEFGNLKIGTSAAVKSMTEDMKGLGDSGLRMSRVFGYGREGLAVLLKENMELAKGMGPIFNRFAASIRGAESEFTVLRKATGLSADAFKSLQLTAENSGVNTGTAIRSLVKDMARAERAFGISVKEMGKDLDFMMKETATFGVMAPQQMLKVSVYSRKLGISMEALKGIMEKTLNFEDAATQTARLSEAFNIQIDAMKLMSETDPTRKMDMYRQAFFKTGQNIESMSVAQKKYLADTTGMTEETLRIAFAQKNRALSGNQLDAQMKKAQKTTITQAEAMKQLAESVKRLVQSGSPLQGSFLDVFAKGFLLGIKRSREFREVVRNLQGSMRAVLWAGRDVGRLFVKEFPGVKQFLKGMAELFHPTRFRALMKQVKGVFSDFFKDLRTDPRAGIERFMSRMKKTFFDFFDTSAPAGRKFIDGLKTFWHAIFTIGVAGVKSGLGSIRDLVKMAVSFIQNPNAFLAAAEQAGDGIVSSFGSMIAYIRTELGPVFDQATEALWELTKLVFKKLYEKYIGPNLGTIILAYFGPAIVGGLLRGAGAMLLKGVGTYITGAMRGTNAVAAGAARAGELGEAAKAVTPESVTKNAATTQNLGRSMFKLAAALAILIAAVSLAVAAIIGLAYLYKRSGVSAEQVIVVGGMFAVMTAIVVAITLAMPALAAAGAALEGTGGAVLAAIGGGLLVVGLIMTAMTVFAAVTLISFTQAMRRAKITPSYAKEVGDVLSTFVDLALKMSVTIGVLSVAAPFLALGSLLGRLTGNSPLQALQKGIEAISTAAIGIISSLSKMTGDPAILRAKAEVFTTIAGGIQAIVGPIAIIASTIGESLFPGSTADAIAVGTNSLLRVITVLVNTRNGLIPAMIRQLQELIGDVSDIGALKGAAEVFSAVAGGLGGVLGAVSSLVGQFQTSVMDSILGIDAAVLESKLASLEIISDRLIPAIQTSLASIFRSVGELAGSITNPEAVKASAGLLSAVSELSSGMLTAVSSFLGPASSGGFAEGLDSVINVISGGRASDVLRDKMEVARAFLTSFSESFTGMFSGPNGIVAAIGAMVNSTPSDPAKLKGLTVVGEILRTITSVMPPILQAVSGFTSNIRPGEDAFIAVIAGEQIRATITSVTDAIKSIFEVVPELIRNLGTLSFPRGLDSKVKSIKGVFGLLQQVSGLIAGFRVPSGSGGATRELNMWSEVFVPIIRLLSFFAVKEGNVVPGVQHAVGHRDAFEMVLNGVATLNFPRGFSSKISMLKTTFEAIKAMSEATKSLRDLGTAGGKPVSADAMSVPLANMSRVISGLTAPTVSGGALNPLVNPRELSKLDVVASTVRGKGSKMERIQTSLSEMMAASVATSNLQGPAEVSRTRFETQIDAMIGEDGIIPYLASKFSGEASSRLNGTLVETRENIAGGITANVRAMIQSYNAFSRDLAVLASGTEPLQVTLNTLGDKLGGAQVATIRNAAVNAEIKVEVKLSAADIVMALKNQTERSNATSPSPNALAGSAFNPATTGRAP